MKMALVNIHRTHLYLLAFVLSTQPLIHVNAFNIPSVKRCTWSAGNQQIKQYQENIKRVFFLKAGFFDDLMNGNLFNNDDNESDDNSKKKINVNDNKEVEYSDETMTWNEADFQKEVQKRNKGNKSNGKNNDNTSFVSSTTSSSEASNMKSSSIPIKFDEEDDQQQQQNKIDLEDFDGYALRDAIYQKWGKCYDIDFQPVQSFGFKELYLNVLPFHLGGRRFRHESELDYLCHLQAVVEILDKYDQLEYVLAQLDETTKKPRAGTSPLVAVPFRLDLTEDELNSILA